MYDAEGRQLMLTAGISRFLQVDSMIAATLGPPGQITPLSPFPLAIKLHTGVQVLGESLRARTYVHMLLLAKVSPSGITWLLALKLKVFCMILIFEMAVSKATLVWLFSSWKKAAERGRSFAASGMAHSPMSNSMGGSWARDM
jgi:hypothetical protein